MREPCEFFGDAMIGRKHRHQKAMVAVARKTLAIMYVMLIRNEPYHGENPELTEQ